MSDILRVGLIGCGVVGSEVVRTIRDNADLISLRSGAKIVVKKCVVRDVNKNRHLDVELSDNIYDVLDDEDIDIVVELIGGVDLSYKIAIESFKRKKSFVSANKAMLAYHRMDLLEKSNGIPFGFEASVCGGIPVIGVLRDGLVANRIFSIKGILNGTSNYVLTQIVKENKSFDLALREAQDRGYAESDPTLDISGGDAAHKLLIMATLAYGIDAKPDDILIEGIEGISLDDVFFASEFGYSIKLLGIAKSDGENLDLRVHLALIKKSAFLSSVDGVTNAISINGDKSGEILCCGAGAGGMATSSAVVSDIVNIARGNASSFPFGFRVFPNALKLKPKGDIFGKYYIRVEVLDEAGVLANISSVLKEFDISINLFLQKESIQNSNVAKLLFSTHATKESNINMAISKLECLDVVKSRVYKIRIEDE